MPENKVGISLVRSLREFLMANYGMTLGEAQDIASKFDSHINWVDWIEVKGGTILFSKTWEMK